MSLTSVLLLSYFFIVTHMHIISFVLIFFRNASNRHTKTETPTGKRTTSRTAQALQVVTARHLTGHRTIARLLQSSAKRRLDRFGKQGRKPKLMVKWSNPTEQAVSILPGDAPKDVTANKKKERGSPKTKPPRQLAQERKARVQQRVKDALAASAGRGKRKNK